MNVDLDVQLRVPDAQEALFYAQRRIDRLRERLPGAARYTVRAGRAGGSPRAPVEVRVEVAGARGLRAVATARDGQPLLALRDAFDAVERRLEVDPAAEQGAQSVLPPRPPSVPAS